MTASTISRRTDEDLLNRSLLDSIEAEALSERVEPLHPTRDLSSLSSPTAFPYALSPQSPQSMHPIHYFDRFPNPREDVHPRQLPLARGPAPPYSAFSLDHQLQRSTTLPSSQIPREQRFQSPVDSYNLSRPFDHRVDSRDFLKSTQYPPPLYHTVASHPTTANIHHHTHRDEEISTIFVVGFPDDMQEREFQNMFIFSKGFEAASLKIPQKDCQTQQQSSPYSQDQSGHVNTVQWNQSQEDAYGSMTSNPVPPPRKQIIGFAKFKTRTEALEARDMLQGKKVDTERGSILKAEMAKKNLHTKRGPGPSGLPLSMVTPGNMVGIDTLATLAGLPGGVAALPTQSSGEAMRDREKELGTLGAMGFIGTGIQRREREANGAEKKRDISSSNRSRFTNSEAEAEADSSLYLRSHNEVAFDAFHAVPPQPYRTPTSLVRSVLSPTDSFSSLSPGQEQGSLPLSFSGPIAATWSDLGQNHDSSTNGSSPQSDISAFPPSLSALSLTDSPPMAKLSGKVDPDRTVTADPPHESRYQFGRPGSHPPSSASSVTGSHSSIDGDTDGPITGSIASLQMESSPPYSTTSFLATSKGNPSDQNPPINTLYVGNLPNTTPSGFAPNLEEALRALFTPRPGFRKLVYKYKNGTPMCFVEFDDVQYATQALNELYGNQVNGLVKSGIRLSYSKNPLGVRPSNPQVPVIGIRGSPWSVDVVSPISPSHVRSSEQQLVSRQQALRPPESLEEVQRTYRSLVMPPANSHFLSFTSDSQPENFSNQNLPGSPSMFSPFQPLSLGAMAFPRETKIPPLTPSPGIEVARAG